MIPRIFQIFVWLVASGTMLSAQERRMTETVDFKRPEAWAMRYFTSALLFQGNAPPPGALEPRQFAAGFEFVNIPRLSEEQRRVGFYGTKEENLNKAPFMLRPLLHYGISSRWSLTASYVPPIRAFSNLRTHLGGLAVNYTVFHGQSWSGTLRLAGQGSESRGDFTVAAEVAGDPDPARNPFGAEEPSWDTFMSWSASLEAGLFYRLPTRHPITWNVNASYTYADLVFQVDAILEGGFHDRARLSSRGGIWTFGTGLQFAMTERVTAGFGLVYVPLKVRRRPDREIENDALYQARISVLFRL